jgi:serine phosphatase RsbU (regulator of sigma subunit)
MGVESSVSSLSGLGGAAGVLDILPAAVILVEPGTARVVYANREAHRIAGGEMPLSGSAEDYARLYPCRDAEGRPVPSEDMPGPRIARREPFSGLQLDWTTPSGVRTVLASGELTRLGDGTEVGVVTFEDVTALEAERRAVRESRDEIRAVLGGVADAVTAQRPDGEVVYANEAALQRLGYSSLQELAAAPVGEVRRRFEFTDEDGMPVPMARLPGRQVLMGSVPEPLVVRHRSPHDGELRWARVQATAVPGAGDSPRLAINVIEDITDIKRAEQGYRFLAEASRILSGSLDYEATLRTVADLAVPRIADWCGVDLVDGDRIDRVAVAHVDPARVAMAREIQERYPPGPGNAIHQIIASGEPQVYSEVSDEVLAAAAVDDEHLEIMRALGMRSVMIVPMSLRGRVLGTISFVSSESGRRFDAQDAALAQDLALRAAAAIDNARLYEASAAMAQTLQRSLLPPHLPEVPGAELAAVYRPAGRGIEVGGDFYDVFDVAEGHWYLAVGDVCGKGPEAAAVTALVRYTLRAAAVRRRSPSAILRWVNDAMLRQGGVDGRFCTVACAHLDLTRPLPRLTVACGGHPPVLLLRAGGGVEEVGAPGTLLGLVDDPDLHDSSTDLAPGDGVVAYTDGLTEAQAPEHVWTPEELEAALAGAAGRSAPEIVEHIVEAALGGLPAPRDDVAVLALRLLPGG